MEAHGASPFDAESPGRRQPNSRAREGLFMKIKKTGIKGGKVVWGE
jgi:hypothetical protein